MIPLVYLVTLYMSYGYGRGYGRGLPTAGPNVKRFLVGSYSALADSATGNIAINVPIDAAAGRMIQLWSIEIEFSDGTWFLTDNKTLTIVVARTAGTAERYVNDPDVIAKFKIHSEAGTGVNWLNSQVFDKDMYPAVPVMNNQIHVTITNSTGVVQTVYAKIWYTDLFVNMQQSLALLQSQVI